jgi:hypothetical protein
MKVSKLLSYFLCAASVVIGAESDLKTFEQGFPVDENQLSKGYNASSRIDVQGAWDVFLDGEFLYWQVNSDHLGFALLSDSVATQPPLNAIVVLPKAKWRPGVRVELGFTVGYDNWMIIADWYHIIGLTQGDARKPVDGTLLVPSTCSNVELIAERAIQNGKANINIVDFVFSRPFYLGTALTVNPVFGIKGYWNKMADNETFYDAEYYLPFSHISGSVDYININKTFKTWGLGPIFGAHANWLLGCGFRMLGGIDLSLLYERADAKVEASSSSPITSITELEFLSIMVPKQNLIRTYTQGELGLGWGTYFDNNNWYFDLAAVYEIHYWDQYYTDSAPFGNLWMHGASFRVRLDF